MRRSSIPLLACLVSVAPGCLFQMEGWGDDSGWRSSGSQTPPPHIDDVYLADWPPLGPTGQMRVTVSGSTQLSRMDLTFRNTFTVMLSGSTQTAVLKGTQLGEGYGDLWLRAYDVRGGSATREVTSLLVDLSPPEIFADAAAVRQAPDGANTDVDIWVADAWVLGTVSLEFAGATLVHEFPPGYPANLGESWDSSLVRFPAADLPESAGPAVIRAIDAAGNEAQKVVDLVVDGTPPVAEIVSPENGFVAVGPLTVELGGSDLGGRPVWLELFAGGAPVATIPGPQGSVVIDPEEFSSGSLTLSAVAVDRAGNRSAENRIVVIVP